jgi:hypothetical protein
VQCGKAISGADWLATGSDPGQSVTSLLVLLDFLFGLPFVSVLYKSLFLLLVVVVVVVRGGRCGVMVVVVWWWWWCAVVCGVCGGGGGVCGRGGGGVTC